MNEHSSKEDAAKPTQTASMTRRRFIGGTLAASAVSSLVPLRGLAADAPAEPEKPAEFKRKIKLGVVGCGGRGSWIANLFHKHGGYEMHGVADYFPEVANKCGDTLGVDSARRFPTLSGYKKLFESGVEAVALEVPPYFLPLHASAAVEAGLHVYMAKPVASDVPGCLKVQAAGAEATKKQRCLLVDYQLPTDPANQEVFSRLRTPGFGKIVRLTTNGTCGGFSDPPRTENMESRLRKLIWVNDIAMGCDYIGNYDIHAIDAALWVAGQAPVAAMGTAEICRPHPHGDSHDVCSVVFEYADGLMHEHSGIALKNYSGDILSCRVSGQTGNALLTYWNEASFRSLDDSYKGNVVNLYEAGAARNIAKFYTKVTEGQFENETVKRAVDGALTCILGKEAGDRRARLTMADILKENKRLEVDLTGLKT